MAGMCADADNPVKHFGPDALAAEDSDLAIETAEHYLDAYAQFVCKKCCVRCTTADEDFPEFQDPMRTWEKC